MSAAEHLIPDPRAGELARIRANAEAETRDFATIRAMAIAKGRGEKYNPERHGPFDLKAPPKVVRNQDEAADPAAELEALLERFRSHGPATGRHLKAVPSDRLDEVIQR